MQHMLSQSEAFFKLPKEQKAKYSFDLVLRILLLRTVIFSSWGLRVRTVHDKVSRRSAWQGLAQTSVLTQTKNIGWESGQQKRASAKVPELKESLQLKWHNMEGKWPTDNDVPDFENYSKVTASPQYCQLSSNL